MLRVFDDVAMPYFSCIDCRQCLPASAAGGGEAADWLVADIGLLPLPPQRRRSAAAAAAAAATAAAAAAATSNSICKAVPRRLELDSGKRFCETGADNGGEHGRKVGPWVGRAVVRWRPGSPV